jgi:hypothetical protein
MGADEAAAGFADIGRERGEIDERRHLRIDAGLGDRHPAPAVADEYDRSFGIFDDAARGGEIVGD